jgi:hypothetical protein
LGLDIADIYDYMQKKVMPKQTADGALLISGEK